MDIPEFDKLVSIFSSILQKKDELETIDITEKTSNYLRLHSIKMTKMCDKLYEILDLTDSLADLYMSKSSKIDQHIATKKDNPGLTDFQLEYKLYKNSGESWADIDEIENKKTQTYLKIDKQIINNQNHLGCIFLRKICPSVYLRDPIPLPVVNKLKDITSCFKWFGGDDSNPKGIYICLAKGCFVRVPIMDTVNGLDISSKKGSVKCKYETLEQCSTYRKNMANHYDSSIRECNFAHNGNILKKIGNLHRCPELPEFGKLSTLNKDLKKISDKGIQTIMMYSLSDLILCSMWLESHKKSKIFKNVDKC
jgi:hypothetical protein